MSIQPAVSFTPSVTVVVCTRDRPMLLAQCLRALSRQAYPRFDVLVVDNSPSRPVRELCASCGVTWALAPLRGVARARNIASKFARGEIVAYIDDDAVAEEGWLQALVEDFADPKVAAVGGRIRYMKAQPGSRLMSSEAGPAAEPRAHRTFSIETPGWFTLACFGGIVDGGNMAFRREAIAGTDPFDERLGRGRSIDSGEEHVAFASLIAQGHRVTYNPKAVWKHPCPPTAQSQTERRFSDLRSSIAYLIFIWAEFPAHRGDILQFLRRAVVKRILPRHLQPSARAPLPRVRAIVAMLAGAAVFWRARRDWAALRTSHPETSGAPLQGFVEPSSGAR